MALDGNVIKERLREIFADESQQTVADKLNMGQGSISKLLTGKQLPTLETLYHIATIYNVSVDWIIGLSPEKRMGTGTMNGLKSYTEVIETITDMKYLKAVEITDKDDEMSVIIKDPLAKKLLRKSLALMKVDPLLLVDWQTRYLSMFRDREIMEGDIWAEKDIAIHLKTSSSEINWCYIHDMARERRDQYLTWLDQEEGDQNG